MSRPTGGYPDGVGAEAETVTLEQALESVETVDGVPTVEGVAIPPYVIGPADTARWVNAQRWAAFTLQQPVASPVVQQLTRTIFHDRETYPS